MKKRFITKILLILLLATCFVYSEKTVSMNNDGLKREKSIYRFTYDNQRNKIQDLNGNSLKEKNNDYAVAYYDEKDEMQALLVFNNIEYPEKPFEIINMSMMYQNPGRILLSPDLITIILSYLTDDKSEEGDQLSILIGDEVYEIGHPHKKFHQLYKPNIGSPIKSIRNNVFYEIDHYILYKLSTSNNAIILLNGSKIKLYEKQLNDIKKFLELGGTKAY